MAKKAMSNGKVDPTPNLASAELVLTGLASNRDTVESRGFLAEYLFQLYRAIRPVEGLRFFFSSDTFRGEGKGFETLSAFRSWLASELDISKDQLKEDTELASRIFGSCDGDTIRMAFTLTAVKEYTAVNGWLFTWSKKLVSWAKKDMALALQGLAEISAESRKFDYKEIEREYQTLLFPKTKAVKDDTPTVSNDRAKELSIADMVKGGVTFTESDALKVIGTLSLDDKASLYARISEFMTVAEISATN